MHLGLRRTVDCTPDDLWEAIRSPEGLVRVSAPLVRVTPDGNAEFPARWPEGDFSVRMSAFGMLPMGVSLIRITYAEPKDGVRMMTDAGGPRTGLLAWLVRGWRHRLAVSAAPGGRALYRDRLEVDGPLAVLAWPALWAFWQWRGWHLNGVARRFGPK
jgi:hypothetical protein